MKIGKCIFIISLAFIISCGGNDGLENQLNSKKDKTENKESFSNSENNVVVLGTIDWEPYIGRSLKQNGYMYQAVIKAYQNSGYDVKIIYLPWARCVKLTEDGVIDGFMPAYYSKERESKFTYSESFPGSPIGFYIRKDSNIKYSYDPVKYPEKALQALSDKKFGIVRGYVTTEKFDSADFLYKEKGDSDEQNIKKLFHGRVDLIAIDKYVAKYIIVKKYPHYIDELTFLEPPLEVKPLYICFSKNSINVTEKQKQFDTQMQKMKKNGELEKLMFEFGL